jgi:hypothetical protein
MSKPSRRRKLALLLLALLAGLLLGLLGAAYVWYAPDLEPVRLYLVNYFSPPPGKWERQKRTLREFQERRREAEEYHERVRRKVEEKREWRRYIDEIHGRAKEGGRR